MPYITVKNERLVPPVDGLADSTISFDGVSVTGAAFPTPGAWTTLSASVPNAFFINEFVVASDLCADGYVEFGWGPAGDERPVGQFATLRNNVSGAGTGNATACFLSIATPLIPAGARLAARIAGSAAAAFVAVGGIRYDRAPRGLLIAHPQGYVFPTSTASGTAGASAYTDVGTLLYPFSITHYVAELFAGPLGDTNITTTLATGPAGAEAQEATIGFYTANQNGLVTYAPLQPKSRIMPPGTLIRAKTKRTLGTQSCSLVGLRGDLPVYSPF